MSNPLDPRLQTLKTIEPRREAVERAVAAMKRSHPPRLVPLAVAAVSLFVLWPHGEAGTAWAQVAAQELPARYHETTVKIVGGKSQTMFETWVDRPADSARRYYNLPSRPSAASREALRIETPKLYYWRYNDVATYSLKPRPRGRYDARTPSAIDGRVGLQRILDDKTIHQLGVDLGVDSRVGKVDRYRLDNPVYTFGPDGKYRESDRKPFTVYVQPGTKRILAYETIEPDGSEWRTTIEYPGSFPAGTFTLPRSQDVVTFNQEKMEADVQRTLARPLATLRAGGQVAQLRLVVQGAAKELWVLWSGAKPNGDLAQKVQVLGTKNGMVYGMAAFTSKGDRGMFSPYGGHSILLDRRVERVDLRVPVFAKGKGRSRFVGYATARDIPVLQVSELHATGIDMGAKRRR